jgi:hypothetical protein
MAKNKYWQTLLGQNVEVLISKQVEYSDSADFEAFVADAVDGELGVFNADTQALVSGLAAVDASTPVFVAVKRGGTVEKTGVFKVSQLKKSRAPYAASTLQASKVTLSGAPAAGKYYEVKVIETTPGHQPFPQWKYGVVVKAGESASDVADRIVALINDKTNVINKDTDSIVTAANAAGVITLTSNKVGVSFRLAVSNDIIETGYTIDYSGAGTAKNYVGNGTYDQIVELEEYSDVLKGVTTNYPGYGMANPEDFGKPSTLAVAGATYNVYLLTYRETEDSPTPVEQHSYRRNIVLAVPSNGAANAEAEVKAILAL